jgi:hypothetical protein
VTKDYLLPSEKEEAYWLDLRKLQHTWTSLSIATIAAAAPKSTPPSPWRHLTSLLRSFGLNPLGSPLFLTSKC